MGYTWLINNEILLRLSFFFLALLLFYTWETLQAWRIYSASRWQRWLRHLSLIAVSQLVIKLSFPVLAVGVALVVEQKHLGLFNTITLPVIIKVILGFLVLDLAVYWFHRMMHKYQWLWRIHRVHHLDRELDVTTGVRFHPFEMLLSMAVKIATVAFLGVPAISVVLFEIGLNLATLFAHANIKLPKKSERVMRMLIITPSMHRIHHSDTPFETNSNYGFCFSFWDRLFASYRPMAKTGEQRLVIGLEEYRAPKFQTLENLLLLPFNLKRLRVPRRLSVKLAFQTQSNVLFPF